MTTPRTTHSPPPDNELRYWMNLMATSTPRDLPKAIRLEFIAWSRRHWVWLMSDEGGEAIQRIHEGR